MALKANQNWWKTLFDEIYLLTDARSVCDESITRREINIILDLIPIKPEHRILDLCGGHGRHSIELCSRGFSDCTLVDYSKPLIDCAKEQIAERCLSIHTIRSDARFTGLSEETFDHVLILGNSLGYTQIAEADRLILSEAFRVLRSGGWVLVDVTDGTAVKETFTPRSWHEIGEDIVVCRYRELSETGVVAREVVLDKKKGLIRDQTYVLRLYDARNLSELIHSAGFEKIRVHTDFVPHESKDDYGFMNRRIITTAQKP
ncbi:MAG: methyltransferase domain-containing protein [Deltaproteobacteria bacterium]|nr:methyltransferase domain-containing protein [Deltaproteobacteria bacterium]MBW1960784.1 methyltransferase domain-containing protein [Deltaproteobacteria bacterium]MBW2153499.1 methyltransferase domain-containing protein [Deltaproteobacteria bacterium]